MIYHFKIHKEKDGFWAQCIELRGYFTQADTLKELHKNMQGALNLFIEEPMDSEHLANLPNESIKKLKMLLLFWLIRKLPLPSLCDI